MHRKHTYASLSDVKSESQMISNLHAAEMFQSSSKSFHLEQRAARAYISKNLQYSLKKKFVCSDPDVMISTSLRQRQVLLIWALAWI